MLSTSNKKKVMSFKLEKLIIWQKSMDFGVVTCLYKAKRRGYISNDIFDKLYKDSFDLMNMTIAFKAKLK